MGSNNHVTPKQSVMIPRLKDGILFTGKTSSWVATYSIVGATISITQFKVGHNLEVEYTGVDPASLDIVRCSLESAHCRMSGSVRFTKNQFRVSAGGEEIGPHSDIIPSTIDQLIPTVTVSWNGNTEIIPVSIQSKG